MSYKQLKEADSTLSGVSGLCLNYSRRVFSVGPKYMYAYQAYKATKYRHTEALPKDVAVPVWFTYKTPGHVAVWFPGKGVKSTTAKGMQWFDTPQKLATYIGGKYLGWTEDINGVRVVFPKPAAPKPVYYIVKKGDTLTSIARRCGTTVAKLVAWNKIKNPNVISIGLKLRVK